MPAKTPLTAYSVPSAEALTERVLARYKLPAPVACHFLHFGVNETYKVTAGNKIFFLRLYRHGWRSRGEILAEVDMLRHLRRHKLGAAHPIRRKDGHYLTRVDAPEGPRYAVLFAAAPGKGVHWNDRRSRDYGALVARIHACLDHRKRDPRRFDLDIDHFVRDPLRTVEPFLAHRPQDLDYLRETGETLGAQIEKLLPRRAPYYGSCHGDHHGGNVHVDDDGNLTLFDFDCYGYGWRAYDICVYLWDRTRLNQSPRQKAHHTRQWNNFLRGYESVRKLSAAEHQAVRLFVPLRHIWLLGLHTQGAHAWGRSWLQDGYFNEHLRYIRYTIERFKLL